MKSAVRDLELAAVDWERWPSSPETAKRMETAARAVAHELGIPTTRLRELISTQRARGLDIDQAIEAVVSDLNRRAA